MAKWGELKAKSLCHQCKQPFRQNGSCGCDQAESYAAYCTKCGGGYGISGEHVCPTHEATWPDEIESRPEGKPIEGRKDDSAKPRYDLIPPEWLDGPAQVLTFGAAKYEARNWEKGMRWGRPFAAMMRHMWAWWRGEKADPETGYSHLWHAACCLMFLMAYEARSIGEDDRPC